MSYDPPPYSDLPPEYRDLMIRIEACVEQRISLGARLQRVNNALTTFYRAPLSMASVQPILDLAVELNPDLKESK